MAEDAHKPPPDTSWVKTTTLSERRPAGLTDAEFDRKDARLGRWVIFCCGVVAGLVLAVLLGWVPG